MQRLIERIARATKGVDEVHNELLVRAAGG